ARAREREPLVPGLVDLLDHGDAVEPGAEPLAGGRPRLGPGDALGAVLVTRQLPQLAELCDRTPGIERHARDSNAPASARDAPSPTIVRVAQRPDVAIVGGGAVGVCCAYELAVRGASVVLYERGPDLASGCSAASAGLVCPSHSAPIANPASLRNGVRWMWRRDSPFYLRPRPAVVPWLARFALAA